MYGYWEEDKNKKNVFDNVVYAIKQRDNHYALQELTDNPQLLSKTDASGNNLLILAAKEGCTPEVFQLLLNQTPDLNQTNHLGQAAIHFLAAHNRYVYLNKLLAKEHVVKDSVTREHKTPVFVACAHESERALSELLAVRADVNMPSTSQNQSPLHIACFGTNAKMIEMLLDAGADPNATDSMGRTPLHYLAQNPKLHLDKKNALLAKAKQKNADLKVSCHEGFTPMLHASSVGEHGFSLELMRHNNPDLYELLDRLHLVHTKVEKVPSEGDAIGSEPTNRMVHQLRPTGDVTPSDHEGDIDMEQDNTRELKLVRRGM